MISIKVNIYSKIIVIFFFKASTVYTCVHSTIVNNFIQIFRLHVNLVCALIRSFKRRVVYKSINTREANIRLNKRKTVTDGQSRLDGKNMV